MATDLQSQYESQFSRHLADNREEQASLRKRLEQLETDEAWLVKTLEAMSAPGKAVTQAPEDEPVQPQDEPAAAPAKKTTAKKTAAKKAPAKKAAAKKAAEQASPVKKATVKKTAAKKTSAAKRQAPAAKKTSAAKEQAPAAKKTSAAKEQAPAAKKISAAKEQVPAAKKAAAKTGEPSLGELLLDVLGKQPGQPRTANEVVSDLEQQYPERARDINTVRNTLERLVAKSRVERTKQKHTVLYTAVDDSAPAAADTAAEVALDAGTADAKEGEKAPAQA